MKNMDIDTSNLTPEQLAVIRRLAFMAEGYCDMMSPSNQSTFKRRGEQCYKIWEKVVDAQLENED